LFGVDARFQKPLDGRRVVALCLAPGLLRRSLGVVNNIVQWLVELIPIALCGRKLGDLAKQLQQTNTIVIDGITLN
jgi:hypothetical protein